MNITVMTLAGAATCIGIFLLYVAVTWVVLTIYAAAKPNLEAETKIILLRLGIAALATTAALPLLGFGAATLLREISILV